jgi:trigger factor
MQSQVHEIDPVTIEVEVEVPWDRIQKGLEAGYGKLQRTAKVRGFRPGKVPRNVLKQLFGAQVRNEVVATLVEEGLIQAVQSHEIALVASPQVRELPSIQEGEPLSFKAKMEVRPKIESVVLEGLAVERPVSEVTDAQIDEEVQRLRERHAEIVTPDPMRPAKAGDLLTIDYVVEVDAEEKPDMSATGRVVELGGGRLLPEFEEGLLGKQPGDEAQIRVAYGDDVQKDELKNRRALFKVTVRELREKVLPELDDEFAKDQGEHETLADLRAAIREQLAKAASQRADSEVREKLVEQLVDKNPIPVPPSLVAQQMQSMQQELAFLMQMAGQAGQNIAEEMTANLQSRAERKVRAGILMGEIARQQELSVQPEEIDARMAQIAEQTGKHIAKVRVEYAGERREALENKILEDKLLDYLLSRATVTEAPAAPAEAGAGQGG